jgi:putative membrane protein
MAFFIARGLKQLLDGAFYFLIPAFAAIMNGGRWALLSAIGGGAVIVLLSLLGSLLYYRRFRFRFGEDRLEVREGVFQRKHTELHYRRVQNLAVDKPWYFRPLGLVTLKVDSAGSAGSEIHLAAITEQRAQSIREHLFQAQQATDASNADADHCDSVHAVAATAEPIHKATWKDLLVYSLSNAAVVFFFALFGPVLGSGVFSEVVDALEASISAPWLWLLNNSLVKLVLLVGLIITLMQVILFGAVAMTFFRHFNFRLFAEGKRFRTLAGLLTERERTLRQEKIQNVVLERPLLTYWRRRTTVRCQQVGGGLEEAAANGNVNAGQNDFLLPAVPNQALASLLPHFVPGLSKLPDAGDFQGVHPRLWWLGVFGWSVVLLGLYVILGGAFGWFVGWGVGLFTSLALVWGQRRSWRRWGYCLQQDYLFVRRGFIGEKITVVAMYRVQGVRLRQSPFQRRRGLADLQLRMASGSLTVPSMGLPDAQALANYALYRGAVTRHGWI